MAGTDGLRPSRQEPVRDIDLEDEVEHVLTWLQAMLALGRCDLETQPRADGRFNLRQLCARQLAESSQ